MTVRLQLRFHLEVASDVFASDTFKVNEQFRYQDLDLGEVFEVTRRNVQKSGSSIQPDTVYMDVCPVEPNRVLLKDYIHPADMEELRARLRENLNVDYQGLYKSYLIEGKDSESAEMKFLARRIELLNKFYDEKGMCVFDTNNPEHKATNAALTVLQCEEQLHRAMQNYLLLATPTEAAPAE